MGISLRTLGSLSLALVFGSGLAWAGELSNVTVGRFDDFTVVTLFGDGPLNVTHQIVEAKDDKPHRIVVDVSGAEHRLPQNNYAELPEGSISAIRTSQFAVSPEPVVRVVLDLAHPAAYRLETSEGEVRLLVSLPNDPPMASTWSARGGALPAGLPEPVTFADAAPAENSPASSEAVPSTSPAPDASSPATFYEAVPESASLAPSSDGQPAETAPAPSQPASPAAPSNPAPAGEEKSLPLAPAGAFAAAETETPTEPSAFEAVESGSEPQTEAPAEAFADQASADRAGAQMAGADQAGADQADAQMADAQPTATEPSHFDEAASFSEASESTNAGSASANWAELPAVPELNTTATPSDEHASQKHDAQAWDSDAEAPQVPLPEASKTQPERTIDYNLPIPASFAALPQAEPVAQSEDAADEAASAEPAPSGPKMAVKSAPEGEAAGAGAQKSATDAAATDVGSAPVASLTTLPPLVESAQDLVPERKQILYHTHGRRDPFKALLTAGGYSAAALPDVTTLRLVGVLQDVKESWGLFEDANGYGYILRKGDRVKNGSLTQLTTHRAYFSLTEFGWSRSVHIDLEPEG